MTKMSGRRSEETWRELLARQSRGGLSVQAFCSRERLNVNTFYGWRSKLRSSAAEREAAGAVRASDSRGRPGEFIDLGQLGGGASRYEIRLDIGGGVVLQVVRG